MFLMKISLTIRNANRTKFGKRCGICSNDITGEYYELDGAVIDTISRRVLRNDLLN